ncbi:MAG TPA: sigma 54-interacting transcriptional regulator [Polyangiaceae bacterium]|nr:sigma 54-interacting transcriptional regulator [Polyangiaceae bacterium]
MQLEALQSLALSVAAARSPDAVLDELVRGLGMTEGVALARVWLLREEPSGAPYLELRASVGTSIVDPSVRWTRIDGAHHRIPVTYGKVGRVAATNTPLLLQRGPRDWLVQPDWAEAEAIESFAGQPLAFRGQVLGVVAVFSRRRLETEDLKWLRVFADHAAVAIANARAFEEIERLKEIAERERDYLREAVRTALQQDEIVAVSAKMKRVLQQAERVAQTDSSVLVLGETGVGKELIAAAIHRMSRRRDGPLVRVNCASVPQELFESEFFGHVRGAFSGAIRDRQGRFLLADAGTLFLDEVGEIPLDLQGKLLRVLQEGTFEPVGDDRTRSVNVRVVAATNRDLSQEVERGRFRRDLYYRLSVLPVEVPPLRERRDDILPLARAFLRATARRLHFPEPQLDAGAEAALLAYDFPGNVRELHNLVERAVVLAPTAQGSLRLDVPLTPSGSRRGDLRSEDHCHGNDLTDDHARARDAKGGRARDVAGPNRDPLPPGIESQAPVVPMAALREMERRNISNALAQCDYRIAGAHGAAKLLGMSPSTLAYHMKRLGLRRPSIRRNAADT